MLNIDQWIKPREKNQQPWFSIVLQANIDGDLLDLGT